MERHFDLVKLSFIPLLHSTTGCLY